MDKVSTTSLAKLNQISRKELLNQLVDLGLITKDGKTWSLTKLGEAEGGEYKSSKRFGTYIVWPKTTCIDENISQVGNYNNHTKTNNPSSVQEAHNNYSLSTNVELCHSLSEFRKKFPANHRCNDGHYVRSRGEALIDNWLYQAGIVHAYERKLPIEEDVYSDFFLPSGNVYIEYWGMENDKYLSRKQEKLLIYKKYTYNLIELDDSAINNLDDVMPKLLIKYGVIIN